MKFRGQITINAPLFDCLFSGEHHAASAVFSLFGLTLLRSTWSVHPQVLIM